MRVSEGHTLRFIDKLFHRVRRRRGIASAMGRRRNWTRRLWYVATREAVRQSAVPSTPWRQASDVARLTDLSLDGAASSLKFSNGCWRSRSSTAHFRPHAVVEPVCGRDFTSLSLSTRWGRVFRHNAITHLLADFARAHNLFESVDVEPHFVSRSGEQ